MGVPFVDLQAKPPDPILATLLPEEVARRYDALPIDRWNDQLVIAMANPTDLFALDDLQMVTRQPIIAAMAVEDDLRAAIDRVYHVSRSRRRSTRRPATTTPRRAATFSTAWSRSTKVRSCGLVNALLEQAITDHASDLHVEPNSTHIAIRFRVDGVLHDSSEVPLALLRPLVSRLKILASLDIAQNRLAQDGRFSLLVAGAAGRRARRDRADRGRRVGDPPAARPDPRRVRLVEPRASRPEERRASCPPFLASQGAAFVTGPTGSGKTSTVYGVLSEINTRSKSIVSVEDPVEYRLDGIKQMQINPRVGLTFPNALPSVLRSDPDIVFIGEVRDAETARIAADASITGHLVLSTLHATRAAAAPMRLIEMGVEPYLVAVRAHARRRAAARARRSATAARSRSGTPASSVLRRARRRRRDPRRRDRAPRGRAARRAAAGFRGRLPIFEIMPVTDGISRLILDRASRAEIEQLAVEEGMDTMRVAALRRVASGVLSIDEMMRVVS